MINATHIRIARMREANQPRRACMTHDEMLVWLQEINCCALFRVVQVHGKDIVGKLLGLPERAW